MSDAVIIAICSTIPPTLVALGALVVGILNSGKVDVLKKSVDGVLADRIQAATDVGHAEGKEVGHAEGVADQKAVQGVTRRTGD